MLISESEWGKKERARREFKKFSSTAEWLDKVYAVCRQKDEMWSLKTGAIASGKIVRIAVLWRQYRIMNEVVGLLERAIENAKDFRESPLLSKYPNMFNENTYSLPLGDCKSIRRMLEIQILDHVGYLFELIEDIAVELAAEEEK